MTTTSQETWRRASVVFEAALGQPEEQRVEFVAKVCGQDDELRDAVTSLLALDEEPKSSPCSAPPESGSGFRDERIGRYRILRPIGRGGMSRIYLGERIGGVEQQVAIKLIGESDRPMVLDLFRRERQILARLEHPYISRFLDGGTTSEGMPYVVMEYVKGFALTEYCDTLRLGVRRRLELFLKVCSAVEYAHRNLVVHRDLKPANILVTDAGEPKLLDFGIAKLLDLPLAPGSSGVTTQERFLTPDYASPEQLTGRGVTTASDLYSLGVLLYELLTGCLPRRLRGLSAMEAMETLERPALPPSEKTIAGAEDEEGPEARAAARGTTPLRLRRRLAGDLDNVVARCLRTEPQERYRSVDRLAEDLRRYLRGLPVHARPPRLLYRSGKFVRRHTVAVIAACVAIVALSAFVAATILYSRRVTRERDLARQARTEAEQVTRYLTDAFRLADVYQSADLGREPGTRVTVRELVDYWAENVDQELRTQPLLQARLTFTLGQVYDNMGSTEQALHFFRQALTMRRRFDADDLKVAQSLNGLGAALTGAGRLDEAEALLREALTISTRLPAAGHVLGDSLMSLGLLLLEKNDFDAAIALLQKALSTRQRLDGPTSRSVAEAWMNLGAAHMLLRDSEAAAAAQREALRILDRVVGEEHPDIATAMSYLGTVLVGQGDYGEAEPLLRKSLEMRRRLLGAEHPETLLGQATLGDCLSYTGIYEEAAALLEGVLEIDRRVKGEDHQDVVKDLQSLALIYWHQGDLETAEVTLREAWEKARRLWGAGNRATVAYAHHLGELLSEKGDTTAAGDLLRQALELRKKDLGPDDRSVGVTSSALADHLARQGRFEEALPLAEQAVRTIRTVDPEGHWRPAVAQSVLGECLAGLGRFEEAEELLVGSLPAIEGARGASRHTRSALRRLVRFYEARGRPDAARPFRARLERWQ